MKEKRYNFEKLREYSGKLSVIDCHDHSVGCGPKYEDPVQIITGHYFIHDMISSSSEQIVNRINDFSLPLEERWPLLEKVWKKSCHTGYAQVTRRVLKEFYGEDKLTLDVLKRMKSLLPDYSDPVLFEDLLEKSLVKARILDVWPHLKEVMEGTLKLSPRGHLALSLPQFHQISCYDDVQKIGNVVNRNISSLDEYLDVCRIIFKSHKDLGAVAFKDQSAYSRSLEFGNPTYGEAEVIFNRFMEDPRRRESYPDGTASLDEYLFHEFMRIARDLALPVQIHTGHMAGTRNNVTKANASGLTRVLELHRDVKFDLFHGNWPYAGDYLFLAKNYPNVSLNLCWVNIIDPVYCRNMFKQIISAVPHGKVHGYGSDFLGFPDRAWAHLQIAKDNISRSLADLIDDNYMDLDDAREVMKMWLFDNPNDFFKLGLKEQVTTGNLV